jgi:hypothetical protein
MTQRARSMGGISPSRAPQTGAMRRSSSPAQGVGDLWEFYADFIVELSTVAHSSTFNPHFSHCYRPHHSCVTRRTTVPCATFLTQLAATHDHNQGFAAPPPLLYFYVRHRSVQQ